MHVIDYDNMDEWCRWFTIAIIRDIAPNNLLKNLQDLDAEFIEDAGDYLITEIGYVKLLDCLNQKLTSIAIRMFHGTRVTEIELQQIQKQGLRALKLADRRQSLIKIFGQHSRWSLTVEKCLDELLHSFGTDWLKSGSGRREDDSVHACLSRKGLLNGCNHYLRYGAEVDQIIAKQLFSDSSGLELLRQNRVAKLVSFTALFAEAAQAANPYGSSSHELPVLHRKLIEAWAYKIANPQFSVADERDTTALKFMAPIPANHLVIEDIDDTELHFR